MQRPLVLEPRYRNVPFCFTFLSQFICEALILFYYLNFSLINTFECLLNYKSEKIREKSVNQLSSVIANSCQYVNKKTYLKIS